MSDHAELAARIRFFEAVAEDVLEIHGRVSHPDITSTTTVITPSYIITITERTPITWTSPDTPKAST